MCESPLERLSVPNLLPQEYGTGWRGRTTLHMFITSTGTQHRGPGKSKRNPGTRRQSISLSAGHTEVMESKPTNRVRLEESPNGQYQAIEHRTHVRRPTSLYPPTPPAGRPARLLGSHYSSSERRDFLGKLFRGCVKVVVLQLALGNSPHNGAKPSKVVVGG